MESSWEPLGGRWWHVHWRMQTFVWWLLLRIELSYTVSKKIERKSDSLRMIQGWKKNCSFSNRNGCQWTRENNSKTIRLDENFLVNENNFGFKLKRILVEGFKCWNWCEIDQKQYVMFKSRSCFVFVGFWSAVFNFARKLILWICILLFLSHLNQIMFCFLQLQVK